MASLGTPAGDPSGTPSGTPSRGPPAPRENFPPGGPPRAPRPGGPPGAPGGPPGPPPGPPSGAPYIYYFVLLRGVPRGVPPGAPRGGPPGGAKKCTFFWVFNNSPSRDKNLVFFPPGDTRPRGQNGGYLGGHRGVADWAVFMAPQELRYAWDWRPRGERCDGTLARPYARGGYVALGWPPPSRQGTEVPRRGVAGARATRPFARAKRGPRSGVPTAAPRSPTRKGLAPRSALDMGGGCGQPPVLSVGDLSYGWRPAPRAGRRTHRRRRLPHSTSSSRHTTSAKKKRFFFRFFPPARRPPGPGPGVPGGRTRRAARTRGRR